MTALVTGAAKGLRYFFFSDSSLLIIFSVYLFLYRHEALSYNYILLEYAAVSYAIVEEFTEVGATVHMCGLDEIEINDCVCEWKAKGFKISGSLCDVPKREEREKLMKHVFSHYKKKSYFRGQIPLEIH